MKRINEFTHPIFIAYLGALIISVVIGTYRYKIFDYKTKIMYWLMLITLASEGISAFIDNRNPIYHIYAIVLACFLTKYFFETVTKGKHSKLMLGIFILWLIAGLINCLFFQPLYHINSNTIILVSFAIICMSLYALYKILIDDSITNMFKLPHFYFWFLHLFLWAGMYFFWIYIMIPSLHRNMYMAIVQAVQAFTNIFAYAGFTAVFLMYPKIVKK